MNIICKCSYEFDLVYKLDFNDSIIFKEVLQKEINNQKYKINQILQVGLEDNGDVGMCYIKKMNHSKPSTFIEQEVIMSFFRMGHKVHNDKKEFSIDRRIQTNLFMW